MSSSSLKKRASNERMTSQSHIVGGPLHNGQFLTAEPIPNGQNAASAIHEPRSNAPSNNGSTVPTRDTALQGYSGSSSTSSSYAPNGYISSRPNGYARYPNSSNPAPPPPPPGPPPARSSTLPPLNGYVNGPNSSPPRARVHLNPSLHPGNSPTSRTFARRAESPPASTYFAASPSSHHRMTPTPGHDARELGDHFSFSTTLRRHTLAPTEEILPFNNGHVGAGGPNGYDGHGVHSGGAVNGFFDSIEERVREVAKPLAERFGVQEFLFPRRADEELNGTEYGYGMREIVTHPVQDRSTAPKSTVSERYAPMPAPVSI